jgi:hypothetical protein
VHIGNTTTKYGPHLTVHHKGYVNGTAALDYLAAKFPHTTEMVVAGESAGSVAAPLYAGLASDRLPVARITALADGSGAYPDDPVVNGIVAACGTARTKPAWAAAHRSLPGFFIDSGRHDKRIVFARHDYASDAEQAYFAKLAGLRAKNLATMMDRNEATIERAGVNLFSYVSPGNEHLVLSERRFYSEKVDGQLFVDWVSKLVARKRVSDVR